MQSAEGKLLAETNESGANRSWLPACCHRTSGSTSEPGKVRDESSWTYRGKTPAVLPAASKCQEQEACQQTGGRALGGRFKITAREQGQRPPSVYPGPGSRGVDQAATGLHQTSALQQGGGHGIAMHVPYIQA